LADGAYPLKCDVQAAEYSLISFATTGSKVRPVDPELGLDTANCQLLEHQYETSQGSGILEQGTHQELLQKRGPYWQMVRILSRHWKKIIFLDFFCHDWLQS
jgi:hypothetical protein